MFRPINRRKCITADMEIIEYFYNELKSSPPSFLEAGPRKYLYFDPEEVRIGIVTPGGIAPGLNTRNRWPPSIGLDGRNRSERVAGIVGMRNRRDWADLIVHWELRKAIITDFYKLAQCATSALRRMCVGG